MTLVQQSQFGSTDYYSVHYRRNIDVTERQANDKQCTTVCTQGIQMSA